MNANTKTSNLGHPPWHHRCHVRVGPMKKLRLFIVLLYIVMCSLVAMPANANGFFGAACTPKYISILVPFEDVPLHFEQLSISSSIDTRGSVSVSNLAGTSIEEVDAQIEYQDLSGRFIGQLWYGGTTGPARHAYFEKLSQNLSKGGTVTLHAMSLRAFAVRPAAARLTGVHVLFSDGRELRLVESEWMFEEFPHKIHEPQFPAGLLPSGDSSFLVDLTINTDGHVREVRDVESSIAPLPISLRQEIQNWRFNPQSRDGKPQSSKIRAVLRILKSGRSLDEGTIPFPPKDLFPSFVVISLGLDSSAASQSANMENFDVYFGHVPFSGTAELIW
jgi:hypothetical protein